MCPNCQAPFVAPPVASPGPPNIDFAAQPSIAAIPARRRPWWPVILALLLAVSALVGIGLMLRQALRGQATQPTVADLAPQGLLQIEPPDKQLPIASAANAEPDQGIFHVEAQAQQPPVIAIGNGSNVQFRLQLENQAGAIRTEWIPPRSERNIVVAAGFYQASIDAPSNTAVHSAIGRVQVKDFHHYEADFFIGSATRNQSFYIGD